MNDEPPPDSGAHAGCHAPLPGSVVAFAIGSLFLIYSAIHAPVPAG